MVTIIVGVIAFIIGVAVGIVGTNWAINDAIGRHFGW